MAPTPADQRVHDDGQRSLAQLRRLRVGRGLLPPLWIGQEHLHDLGTTLRRRGDRVGLAYVGTDEHGS